MCRPSFQFVEPICANALSACFENLTHYFHFLYTLCKLHYAEKRVFKFKLNYKPVDVCVVNRCRLDGRHRAFALVTRDVAVHSMHLLAVISVPPQTWQSVCIGDVESYFTHQCSFIQFPQLTDASDADALSVIIVVFRKLLEALMKILCLILLDLILSGKLDCVIFVR